MSESQETKAFSSLKRNSYKAKLKLEFDSRYLPAVPLFYFSGNASQLPVFIKKVYFHGHRKLSFDSSIKMTYIMNTLEGAAKRPIRAGGTSGLFYANALTILKPEFRNTLLLAHRRILTT